MFTSFQNHARLRFRLVPRGPLLVRSGEASLDPALAEMEFQRTTHEGRRTVFLAGSGLKGAIRAHCERLLRSAGQFACDPTKVEDNDTCGNEESPTRSPADYPFDSQCAGCFTFGSLNSAGRFRVDDAFPGKDVWEETNRTERRTQVGLDRKSQSASTGALFDLEVVVSGGFDVTVSGENFSLWQLGLVLQALEDLDLGLFQIGGLKSRGMGTVGIENLDLDLRTLGGQTGKLAGLRNAPGRYQLPDKDEIDLPSGSEETRAGLFREIHVESEAVGDLRRRLVEGPLTRFLGLEEG